MEFRYFPLVSRSTGFEGLDLSMISGIGIKVNYAGEVHVVHKIQEFALHSVGHFINFHPALPSLSLSSTPLH